MKVASAFALHNWVANVKRVSKHPGPQDRGRPGIPQAGGDGRGDQGGDARACCLSTLFGVLLPTDDFSPNQTRNYLRIAAGDTTPAGLVGTAWGDERIAGAARLAGRSLEPSWRALGLYRIRGSRDRAVGATDRNWSTSCKPAKARA